MFKIGEKAVCIKPIDGLIKDKLYTIKVFSENKTGIKLVEYNNDSPNLLVYYFVWRFKKLDYEFVKQVCEMIEEDNLVKVYKQ